MINLTQFWKVLIYILFVLILFSGMSDVKWTEHVERSSQAPQKPWSTCSAQEVAPKNQRTSLVRLVLGGFLPSRALLAPDFRQAKKYQNLANFRWSLLNRENHLPASIRASCISRYCSPEQSKRVICSFPTSLLIALCQTGSWLLVLAPVSALCIPLEEHLNKAHAWFHHISSHRLSSFSSLASLH